MRQQMVERAIALQGTCTGESCAPFSELIPAGEHGVGIGKRVRQVLKDEHRSADAGPQMYLRSELGDGTIAVMKTLKNALDPHGIMNPGKVSNSPVAQVAELTGRHVAVPRLDYIDWSYTLTRRTSNICICQAHQPAFQAHAYYPAQFV
jgi:hypothetical protein